MKIAITGGIGSGKSTFLTLLHNQYPDILQVSMDSLAHKALNTPELQEYCLKNFASTDRKEIGHIIFNPKNIFEMAFLEFKIYPIVFNELKQLFTENENLFVEVPLLYEKGFQNFFDKVIVVSCPLPIRFERVKKRDFRSDEQIHQILSKQLPQEIKDSLADCIYSNDNTSNNIEEVYSFINLLLK